MIARRHARFALLALGLAGLAACGSGVDRETYALTGGSAVRGRAAIGTYGCGACHRIPGVRGADGRVGPSLRDIADQAYVGGVVSNTPQHLMAWIQNAPALSPRTAMPDLNVSPADARDIAAYLYTLR
jgi:cytochrome c551/c552